MSLSESAGSICRQFREKSFSFLSKIESLFKGSSYLTARQERSLNIVCFNPKGGQFRQLLGQKRAVPVRILRQAFVSNRQPLQQR